jgi:predicted nucleic acid-binding protein
MAITIDASVVAAWLLPDEASPAADQLYALALQANEVFQAPGLLTWEVGNLLNTACRRKRLTPKLATDALTVFLKAGIQLMAAPQGQRMQETLDLARLHDLSFCDASYMEQALRTGAKLATKDASLRRQALKAGVLCLEL